MRRVEAFNWFSKYKSEVMNVKDAEHSGPTSISKINKDVTRIINNNHAETSPSAM